MRKLFSLSLLLTSFLFTNAQELLSKKGTHILPEAKDWSIGLQADPLLKYFGNFFNKDNNNNNTLQSQIPLTLTGKYVKDDHTAYRFKLRIGLESRTTNNFVDDDAYTGAPPNAKITDTWKATSSNLTIGTGIQKSRGKGRLRGIYGIDLGIGFTSSTDKYTYGNSFSASTSEPTSTTDWSVKDTSGNYISGPVPFRISMVKNPNTFNFVLNGFIGAEYFFAPKLSFSAEYGWGFDLSAMGEKETFRISSDGGSGKESSSRNAKSSSLVLDVTNVGSIALHLYF